MKKILKSRIFIFILGGLIFGSVGVYAATLYEARLISYEGVDGSTNVNDALDELFDRSSNLKKDAILAGTISIDNRFSMGVTGTLNLSGYEGYQDFELYKNIFPVSNSPSISSWEGGHSYKNFRLTYSYNKNTGILSIEGYSGGHTAFIGSFNVYVIN